MMTCIFLIGNEFRSSGLQQEPQNFKALRYRCKDEATRLFVFYEAFCEF